MDFGLVDRDVSVREDIDSEAMEGMLIASTSTPALCIFF